MKCNIAILYQILVVSERKLGRLLAILLIQQRHPQKLLNGMQYKHKENLFHTLYNYVEFIVTE